MSIAAPLILTADMDSETQEWFNQLRQKHCPERLRILPAHLTLFHALPGDLAKEVVHTVKASKADRTASASVSGVRSLGNGVAYRVHSDDLTAIRTQIASAFDERLSAQDKSKNEFHVTIQNKVDASAAKALFTQLSDEFEPFEMFIEGISVWRYLNGPWELFESVKFE